MQRLSHNPLWKQHPRRGFTLIELLVVIVVIAILVSLLFPVLTSAIRSTREAQVVVEMSNFDKALVEFKSRYGVDVPSFIVLCEQGSHWTDPSPPYPAGITEVHRRTSVAFIRQVWPEFDFTYAGSPTGSFDLNDNGDNDEILVLNGSECLVFFLAGVVARGPTQFSVGSPISETMKDDTFIGFAANPQTPFDARSANNRVGPFFPDILVDRLTDVDQDGMPEYKDGLAGQQRPYVYLSSYDGSGYRPLGLDLSVDADDEIPPALGLMDAYYKTAGPPKTYLNPQTYQLISPGSDTEFGAGGVYNGEKAGSAEERDNITNFKRGRLN